MTNEEKIIKNKAGLLLSSGAAIGAPGWAGRMTAQAVWNASGLVWAALLASLAAGLTAGMGAGWLVRLLWGRLFRPGKRMPGQIKTPAL